MNILGIWAHDLMTTSHVVFFFEVIFPSDYLLSNLFATRKKWHAQLLPEIQLFRINLKKSSYSFKACTLRQEPIPSLFLMESCDTLSS